MQVVLASIAAAGYHPENQTCFPYAKSNTLSIIIDPYHMITYITQTVINLEILQIRHIIL